jgi:hypothetical protein
MIMTTDNAERVEQYQSDVASPQREATAAVLNIGGRWDLTLHPHDQPDVSTTFAIFIRSGPLAHGVIEGSLVDADNRDLPGGRLIGIFLTTSSIMCFKVSVGGIRYSLIGRVLRDSFPLDFDGIYIRMSDGAALAAEPGETGTGGGSQST